ncbi:MAG: heavy metal-associated domain-containing protein [Candidatus Scalinduaceae bacterium]
MFTNKYLNLGYFSVIAIFLGIIISMPFANIATSAEKKEQIEVKVKGMGCEMCAKAIKTLIMKCDGVEGCVVSFKDGKAEVVIEADKDKEDVLREIDEKMFFPYTLLPAP